MPADAPERGFVLGVDLDGVCGDYTTAFANVVAHERGVDPASLSGERGWDFAEWGLADLGGFDAVHRRAVLEHRMFRTMPVMPGAAEVLWRLSDAGVWIRIITHRLYVNWGHAIAVSDTVEWLDRHAIPYRDICFLGRKPEVEADCYVDDSPDVVAALRGAGNTVVVFDAPYNRHLEGPRAESWADVEHAVAERITASGIALQPPLPGLDQGPDRLRGRIGS
jgi:5'(3')-deoxyribonucleotidase